MDVIKLLNPVEEKNPRIIENHEIVNKKEESPLPHILIAEVIKYAPNTALVIPKKCKKRKKPCKLHVSDPRRKWWRCNICGKIMNNKNQLLEHQELVGCKSNEFGDFSNIVNVFPKT